MPSDNPFVGVPGRDEIWSSGLRNPWRFSFDRATGDLVITDVGQDAWEEVEYAPRSAGGGRGDNYGWSCREGPDPYTGCPGTFTDPAFVYPHFPTGCTAITGGYVVRDPGLPSLLGRYLYADFCQNMIRSLRAGPAGGRATTASSLCWSQQPLFLRRGRVRAHLRRLS